MAGIIGAALAGGAAGFGAGVAEQGKMWSQAIHQDTLNEAQAQRARSLAELQGEIQTRLEKDVRQPFQTAERVAGETFQAGQNEAQRGHATQLQKTSLEAAAEQHRLDRQVTREGHALTGRQVSVLEKGAELDRQIKDIQLKNAKEVTKLQEEFRTATPERQRQIREHIQILTGKDNDNYLPVPVKDDLGNTIGYEVLDRRTGQWVEAKRPGSKVDWSQFQRNGPGQQPGQPGTTAPARPSPTPAKEPPATGETAEIRQLRGALRTAEANLMSYGAAKRRDDPQGFAAARQAVIAAKAALQDRATLETEGQSTGAVTGRTTGY